VVVKKTIELNVHTIDDNNCSRDRTKRITPYIALENRLTDVKIQQQWECKTLKSRNTFPFFPIEL